MAAALWMGEKKAGEVQGMKNSLASSTPGVTVEKPYRYTSEAVRNEGLGPNDKRKSWIMRKKMELCLEYLNRRIMENNRHL